MRKLLQAGAVPFRSVGANPEFLLVTSRRGNWIFPKGIVEPGESPEQTARKEAEEEAGIRGVVLPGPVGSYEDEKGGRDCQVLMFLLRTTGDSDSWREGGARTRRWCSYGDAVKLLKKRDVREILHKAIERLLREPTTDA